MLSRKLAPVAILVVVLSILVLAFYAGMSMRLVGTCPVMPPEACIAIYDPVYGIPTFRVHSNSCMACMEGAWIWIRTMV